MKMSRLRRAGMALAISLSAGILPGVASAKTVHFKSPSGNINCYLFSTPRSSADCIVRTISWAHPPARPSSCDLDWAPNEVQLTGQAVTLGGCRGDIGPLCGSGGGPCTTLAYGRSVTAGTIRCASAPSGVTCRSMVGPRHGFRVARETVVLFR